jgi:hypothetical protein
VGDPLPRREAIRMETFSNRAEALEAFGLSE